jgi:hypothetical protein
MGFICGRTDGVVSCAIKLFPWKQPREVFIEEIRNSAVLTGIVEK